MKISRDWRYILNRAWSVRLMILSAVLGAVEVALPLWSEVAPKNWFATLSMLVAVLAAVVRVLQQPGMDRRKSDEPVLFDKRAK